MKSLYLLIIASLMLGQIVAAQGPDTVRLHSLGELIAKVIKTNPSQAIYALQVKQASYNYKASRGFLLPNASGNFAGTDNLHLSVTPVPGILIGQPGSTFYAQFGKKYSYNTGVTLSQDIFDWPSVLQAQIADHNIKLAQLQDQSYLQGLKEQTARLYFSALIARSALKIVATDQLLADSLLALTRQKLREGATDLLAVNQATINANSIRQNQAQSQQLYDQSVENIKILLGKNALDEIILAGAFDMDSLKEAPVPILGSDKTLDVYRQQADITAIQSRAQRSAAYPKLSASMYIGAQQFRDDFGLGFSNNAWSAYRYIGLNLSVPLFTGFSNTNKYKSAAAQQQIAQLQYDNGLRQSAINDRLMQKNYADYQQLVRSSGANFKLYGDNLGLNKQKYQEGIIGMDTYFKAFQDYLSAENVYLNNLSQLLATRSTLLSRQ